MWRFFVTKVSACKCSNKLDDSFFASLIEANFFYKKGTKILKKEFVYNIAEAKTLKEAKEFTQKTKQLFLNDLQKLGRLLDILCTF